MSEVQSLTIHDEASGSTADILVGYGLNCYRLRIGDAAEGTEVLWAEEGFETGTRRPSGSGIPILFPFPGRIPGTTFAWNGQSYELAEGDGQGNAIHGFVHHRPWRILEHQPERVVAQFHASEDAPELTRMWPADFRITATYQLSNLGLSCRFFVENPDDVPLPCGLGVHPYFRLPAHPEDAARCAITVPVGHIWRLQQMHATGETQSAEQTGLPSGIPFGAMQFDHVFGGLKFHQGWCRASIRDPSRRQRLELCFDEAFRECVVYNPPHRQAVCIEPYTCVPNCFQLQSPDVDAGLRVLEPGDAFTARMRVELHADHDLKS